MILAMRHVHMVFMCWSNVLIPSSFRSVLKHPGTWADRCFCRQSLSVIPAAVNSDLLLLVGSWQLTINKTMDKKTIAP